MSERVLVTGASGFVASRLIPEFVRTGRVVRAATRHPESRCFPKGVEVVAVPDFRRPIDWAPMLAGVDSVVHLACIAHVGMRDPDAYDRVIHIATAGLASACAQAGVRRLVYMSSLRAQSGATASHVLSEADEPQPTEDYGRSKLRAEAAVRSSGVAWTILRPTLVYGPGVKGNFASLVKIANSPWPLPFAGFANRRSLLSLDNLVSAISFVLGNEACARETYLVADPQPLTLAEIITALRLGAHRPPRLFAVPPRVFEGALKSIGRGDLWERIGGSLVVDPAKLMAAGWRPDRDTKRGLSCVTGAALQDRATGASGI